MVKNCVLPVETNSGHKTSLRTFKWKCALQFHLVYFSIVKSSDFLMRTDLCTVCICGIVKWLSLWLLWNWEFCSFWHILCFTLYKHLVKYSWRPVKNVLYPLCASPCRYGSCSAVKSSSSSYWTNKNYSKPRCSGAGQFSPIICTTSCNVSEAERHCWWVATLLLRNCDFSDTTNESYCFAVSVDLLHLNLWDHRTAWEPKDNYN